MKTKLIAQPLPDMPWEDRPGNCTEVLWRYSANPVIPGTLNHNSNSIYNSGIVPFENGYAGVFRVDDTARIYHIHSGKSRDGINWEISDEPIEFSGHSDFQYDPRVIVLEGRYYITWCNGYYGPTIGVAWTDDFQTFHQMENAFLPYNRNGVLFPRKVGSRYAMLSRPSDQGHTPFGDIFYSQSPDLEFWGRHRHIMSPSDGWQHKKIGPGPAPIETAEGWLLLYHGVLHTCNGFVYSMGSAILDIDRPWEVKYRSYPYLLTPQQEYEMVGNVPNVIFPCATVQDGESGRIAIYYGAADTCTALAFAYVDELLDFTRENSCL